MHIKYGGDSIPKAKSGRRTTKKEASKPESRSGIISGVIFVIVSLLVGFVLLVGISAFYLLGYPYKSVILFSDTGIGFALPASVLLYLLGYKRMSPMGVVESLGLGRDKLSLFTIGLGVIIFVIILTLTLLTTIISNFFNTPINTNIGIVLAGAPFWFYLFAALIEPINEEILFRGFLVPRIGVLLSAILFGIPHASYDSSFFIEVIAAMIFGLIAGYAFKRTRSLYPSIIAHILVNSLAVISFL